MAEQISRLRRAKHGKENPYFLFSRITAQEKGLSYEAAGMLAYLLSKPDDWVLQPTDLQREGCKRDKVYRILRELINTRYIQREWITDPVTSEVKGIEYLVYEDPYPEKPDTDKPYPGKPYRENKDSTDKRGKQNKRKKQNTDSDPADAADSSQKTRKPAINQSFKDAIAVHIQNIEANLAGKRTGFIANVIADVAKRRLSVDKLTAEQYQTLADNMPAYGAWIRIEFNVGYDIFAPATHEDMYAKWLTAGKPDIRKDVQDGQTTPANQSRGAQSKSRLPNQTMGAAGSKDRTGYGNHHQGGNPSQESNYKPGAVAELHRNRKNGEV